jgi:hypothetical protein
MNVLVQLVAEWLVFRGYFGHTNTTLRPRVNGGCDNEIDVREFKSSDGEPLHVGSSWDSSPWPPRNARLMGKKFVLSNDGCRDVEGQPPRRITKMAAIGGAKSSTFDLNWRGGVEVKLMPGFISEVCTGLTRHSPSTSAVPEGLPRLRAMQFGIHLGWQPSTGR